MRLSIECKYGSKPAPKGHTWVRLKTRDSDGWEDFLLPNPDITDEGFGLRLQTRGSIDGVAHLSSGDTVELAPGTFTAII